MHGCCTHAAKTVSYLTKNPSTIDYLLYQGLRFQASINYLTRFCKENVSQGSQENDFSCLFCKQDEQDRMVASPARPTLKDYMIAHISSHGRNRYTNKQRQQPTRQTKNSQIKKPSRRMAFYTSSAQASPKACPSQRVDMLRETIRTGDAHQRRSESTWHQA